MQFFLRGARVRVRAMGMVTLHLVIGVGVFLVPLFLLFFSTLPLNSNLVQGFDSDLEQGFNRYIYGKKKQKKP